MEIFHSHEHHCSYVEKAISVFFVLFSEKLKNFLMEFSTTGPNNRKTFKYARQLTELAHRDQVSMHIELDDLEEHDPELCSKVVNNSKRYIALLYDIVQALLPDYKTREVTAKDSLGNSRK